MKINMITGVIVAALVAGGGGFYGGIKYDQAHPSAAAVQDGRGGFGGQGRGGRFGGPGGNGGFANGEILSKDATSVTIKMRDGGSKIIFVSPSTQIMKAASGTENDLTVGTQVTAMGTANSDGSIAAQNIQIRPAMPTTPTPKP